MTTEQKIIRAAGKRGKTKYELAAQFGLSYSRISALVNALVKAKALVRKTTRASTGGRRPAVYARVA